MPTRITNVVARDIRFPTSRTLDGSDAMNPDPDYSAAYVLLETDHPRKLAGHGFTFTIGRGNELCVAAIEAFLAVKYGKPVCPHAGGVGLCEYMQHISMIDFVVVSGRRDEAMC